jgi:Lar family restriction alleviation protein
MTKENELKPCPFCGGKANLYRDEDRFDHYLAQCETSGCVETPWHTKQETIRIWNTRANSPDHVIVRRETLEGIKKPDLQGEEYERPEPWMDDVYPFESGEVVGSVWSWNSLIDQLLAGDFKDG